MQLKFEEEFSPLTSYVLFDPNAFVSVSCCNQVNGRGVQIYQWRMNYKQLRLQML